MLYRTLQRKDDEPGLDMTHLQAAYAPRGLGRVVAIIRQLVFAGDPLRSRRAVERELEDLYHPFD
ncbi:MAG TPA: hypothetical protein VMA09_00110 [Candidatus Binataceae bacterium]|nr:hypothetical protein [Candidatus Binataceae bacterium]